MENVKIKNKIFPSYEDLYQEFINKTLENSLKYKDIHLNGKILHYLNKPTFYFYCTVNKNSNSNPFYKKILFYIEFIDGEIPYVTLLTDFINVSLNDNRNYYKCLSNEDKYKFSLENFKDIERILDIIMQGIPNFLNFIKESELLNTFIFCGEYEYNHIYQINDFLQNKNILNYYRIYLLNYVDKNKNKYIKEEKYIIFTKLYFLIFEPLEEDKALIRLLFYDKLKDMDISLEINEINNSIIFKYTSYKTINEIEFILIDRQRQIEKKINIDKTIVKNGNSIENVENKVDKNKYIIKNETKEIKDKKEKLNNSNLMKEWFDYLHNIDFKKYELIIYNYKILFRDYKGKLKIKSGEKSYIQEYNNLIEFYEKIINLYENNKKENIKERIHKLIGEIIYICSELIDYAKNQNKNENEYYLKIQKYLKSYK